jgi:hypothetical protein
MRPQILDDFDDGEYLREVYNLDFEALPGETPLAYHLRFAFAREGYAVKGVEEVIAPPVIILRAVRKSAPAINDEKMVFDHIRDVLKRAGFRLRKDELTLNKQREQILVAFLSGRPRPDFRQILLEPQED